MEFYHKRNLINLKRLNQLYPLLEINKIDLKQIISYPDYKNFTIPKKRGGSRQIDSPGKAMLQLQKKLNVFLNDVYKEIKPEAVHGFIRKSDPKASWNIKSNASAHVGKNYVLNIDLKDFFHSITTNHVKQMFMNTLLNCDESLATTLALICCYKRKLPMGAPTSPMISNLYCYEMDLALTEFSVSNGLTYTRYADDLTFSCNQLITEELIHEIRSIITRYELVVNESKVCVQTKFGKQWVTGLKVNEKVNVDRKYKRNIRAILFDIKQNGIEAAAMKHYHLNPDSSHPLLVKRFEAKLAGQIGWMNYIQTLVDQHK